MFGSPEERALRKLVRRYKAEVVANPRDLATRLKLAHSFQMLGQQADAKEELTIVARLAARAGASLEALSTLHEILALDPRHTETQRLLSSLYAREATEAAVPQSARIARPLDEGNEPDGEPTQPSRRRDALLLTTPGQAQDRLEGELIEVASIAPEEVLSLDDDDDAHSEVSDEDIIAETGSANVERDPLPLFSALGKAAFEALVSKLRGVRHPAGTVLCEEGDPGDSVLLLVAGTVHVEKGGNAGRRTRIATLEPGAFFGEFGFLTDRVRHARVVAETAVEVLEATREVIEATALEHPEIQSTLLEFYGRRLVETMSLFSPVLRLLKPEARTRWLQRFTRRAFQAGETILEEGSRGEGLFIILRGDAEVDKRKPDGTKLRVTTLHEGDFFGEASLLTGRPVMASIRAATELEALALPASDFSVLLRETPAIRKLLQAAAVERQLYTQSLVAGRATPGRLRGGPVLV